MKIALYFIGLLLLMQLAIAFPPISTEFYGTVTYFNEPAETGKKITAKTFNGTVCGEFSMQTIGGFGLLSCKGDDPSTAEVEGPVESEEVVFYVDNVKASVFGNYNWSEASFKIVNLVIPELSCGDNFCDLQETCTSCGFDCGVCGATGSGEGNGSSGAGGGGGAAAGGGGGAGGAGSGGGSGGGGGSGSGLAGGFLPGDIFGLEGVELGFVCDESWSCGNWSDCPPTEIQARNCTDLNSCGTFKNKPIEKKACIYDEEFILEEIRKREEEKKKPKKEIPLEISFPKIVCKKETNPFKNNAVWFFLAILVLIGGRIYLMEKELDSIKKKKHLDDVKRAKLEYSSRKKAYTFIGIMIFFAIVIYLFYVFFFLCEINFTALWILLAVLLILPFFIHKIIDFLEYHEHEKIIKMEELADTHYQQISKLIEIETTNIADIEKEIANRIAMLSERASFKKILKNYAELEKIYLEIVRLYKDYYEKKTLFKEEEKLVDDIYDLANKDSFVELSEKSPSVKLIYEKLLLLYRHYEEKQELYEELAKTEEEIRNRPKQNKIYLNKNNEDNKNDI